MCNTILYHIHIKSILSYVDVLDPHEILYPH